MKECKVIHIHSGKPTRLEEGAFRMAGDYTWSGDVLAMYRNTGWEVVQIMASFSPAIQNAGSYSFYKDGILAVLEREVREDNPSITEDMWKACGRTFDKRRQKEELEEIYEDLEEDDLDD